MAGYDNIKDKGFDKRTTDERRELAIKAGKASGEARRRKADFKRILNLLLTTEIENEELTPILKAMGLDSTLESAVNMAMIKRAMQGDTRAYELIARFSGQTDKTDEDLEEQKIRTDRAKRARDQEVGDTDVGDENIQSFLKAINPNAEDMESLFPDEPEEDENNGEEKETSGEI